MRNSVSFSRLLSHISREHNETLLNLFGMCENFMLPQEENVMNIAAIDAGSSRIKCAVFTEDGNILI